MIWTHVRLHVDLLLRYFHLLTRRHLSLVCLTLLLRRIVKWLLHYLLIVIPVTLYFFNRAFASFVNFCQCPQLRFQFRFFFVDFLCEVSIFLKLLKKCRFIFKLLYFWILIFSLWFLLLSQQRYKTIIFVNLTGSLFQFVSGIIRCRIGLSLSLDSWSAVLVHFFLVWQIQLNIILKIGIACVRFFSIRLRKIWYSVFTH